MQNKLLIGLFMIWVLANSFCTLNADAKDALRMVQITKGIDQRRPAQNSQIIGRRYVWNFHNSPYTILMQIEIERYNSYSSKERYNIPEMVEEGTTALANLTREFQKLIGSNPSWSEQDEVNFVLSFVQALPYTRDNVVTGYDEFRRYAIETLIEGGGDCEDTTILSGAILCGLGETVALVSTYKHIGLGVSGNFSGSSVSYKETKYYYCETTGTGWTIGQLPPSVRRQATITPLTTGSIPPKPEPSVVSTPDTVRPTPETAVVPPPNPEEETSKENTAGAMIVILFLLVGFGTLIAYFLYHFIMKDGEDDGQGYYDDEDEYDDDPESGSIFDQR